MAKDNKQGNISINVGDKKAEGYYVGSASNMMRVVMLGMAIIIVGGFYIGNKIGKLETTMKNIENRVGNLEHGKISKGLGVN